MGEKVIEYEFLTDEEKVEVREISSTRLALMNYDWARIKVGDIFIFLASFLPPGGEILNVRLYQSEFGKERMRKEQELGPIAIMDENAPEDDYEDNETNARLNDYKVRKYELDRLKYYYSIIEFDSGKTADIVFSQCNGIELESTGIKIDLRAVPDELEIPGPIVDECEEKPNKSSELNFINRSKQHTSVKVTWEEEEKGNKNAFLFEGDDNIFDGNKVDLHEIVASEDLDSEEDDGEEHDVNRLRAKLLGRKNDSSGEEEDGASDEEQGNRNVYADFDKKNRHKGVEVSFLQAFQDEDSSSDEEDKKKIQFSSKNRRDIVRRNSDDEEENEDIEVEEDEFFNIEDQDDGDQGQDEGRLGKDKKQSKKEQFRKKLKDEKKAKRAQEQDRKSGVRDKRQQAN